jgi:hypothetical protein
VLVPDPKWLTKLSMAFTRDFRNAALRHWTVASKLAGDGSYDAAGYLFGFAGECRLKLAMEKVGIRPLANERRFEDPFRAHFPEIKVLMLVSGAAARISSTVVGLLDNGGFMGQWDTDMRYARSGSVDKPLMDRWRSGVEKLFEATEFLI